MNSKIEMTLVIVAFTVLIITVGLYGYIILSINEIIQKGFEANKIALQEISKSCIT